MARTLLPPTTRGLVTTPQGAALFDPIVKFTEWIQARTEFIDGGLDAFLSSPVCNDSNGKALECNVVLFGAGYDTRALRYRHAHDDKINFMEVDLADVVEGKGKLYKKFQRENDPDWDVENKGSTLVPFNLNDCGGEAPKSLIGALRDAGLKEGVPTMFVWEAVLFYVDEDAVRNIMGELFDFAGPKGNAGAETMLCFTGEFVAVCDNIGGFIEPFSHLQFMVRATTDSLKPFVDVPFTSETNTWFSSRGVDLLQHRSRWGGAVHFALAASRGFVNNSDGTTTVSSSSKEREITGTLGKYVADKVG